MYNARWQNELQQALAYQLQLEKAIPQHQKAKPRNRMLDSRISSTESQIEEVLSI